jgi:hypothetical protein
MNAQPLASQSAFFGAQSPFFGAQSPLALVVVTSDGRFGYCGTCAAETVFERPLCVDGHGDLCAEWVCTDCGTAVVVEIGDYLEPLPAQADQPVRTIGRVRRVVAA